jgi:hypothetical protein
MRDPLDIFADDPMAWREFLDNHEELPLWVRVVSKIRYILGI